MIRPESGEGSAEIVEYSPNRIHIRTESSVPKLLFLSDVFDKGWQATIDGNITPVYRANFNFRAIAVSSGSHTVEYRYRPKSFRLGQIIAIISGVVGVFGLIFIKKKKYI